MSAMFLSCADRFSQDDKSLALKMFLTKLFPKLTPNSDTRVRERELEKVRPLGGPPRAGGGATTLFSCEFIFKEDIFISGLLSTGFSGKGLKFRPIRSEKTVLSRF